MLATSSPSPARGPPYKASSTPRTCRKRKILLLRTRSTSDQADTDDYCKPPSRRASSTQCGGDTGRNHRDDFRSGRNIPVPGEFYTLTQATFVGTNRATASDAFGHDSSPQRHRWSDLGTSTCCWVTMSSCRSGTRSGIWNGAALNTASTTMTRT